MAIVVSGTTATALSGEFLESWSYLLLDLAESALGVALGSVAIEAWRSFIKRVTPAKSRDPNGHGAGTGKASAGN
jgi:hypothetical protein